MSAKKVWVLGGGVAVALIVGFGLSKLWSAPPPAIHYQYAHVHVASTAPVPVTRPLPLRLKIPKLKVDADIKALGVTPAGNMEAPSNIKDVGWYKFGPRPGETGSAVIAGHFGTLNRVQSVFNRLKELKAGDVLSVADDAGRTTSYAVRQTRTYRDTDLASEVFEEPSGVHLNLITCSGPWDKPTKRFTQRLVVFADKVE